MKALICEAYGPPETLGIVELPEPVAGPGEALVGVSHASLNFFDLLVIENKYQVKPPLPFSPAAEFSGRILALGPDVEGFSVGDRVLGYTGFGANASSARFRGWSGCPTASPTRRRRGSRSPMARRCTRCGSAPN